MCYFSSPAKIVRLPKFGFRIGGRDFFIGPIDLVSGCQINQISFTEKELMCMMRVSSTPVFMNVNILGIPFFVRNYIIFDKEKRSMGIHSFLTQACTTRERFTRRKKSSNSPPPFLRSPICRLCTVQSEHWQDRCLSSHSLISTRQRMILSIFLFIW